MGQASTSEVREKRETKYTQHMRREWVRNEEYEVQSGRTWGRNANKKQKLKWNLVEAKPDGTIFSPSTKLQRPLYTTTKSRETPIKYHEHNLQYQNPNQYNTKTSPYSNVNSF